MQRLRGDHNVVAWVGTGGVLLGLFVALLAISPLFTYGVIPPAERPIGAMVTLMMLAGAAYLAAVWLLRWPLPTGRQWRYGWWAWMLGVGLVIRLLMLASVPMLETDFYRYLWEGGVVAAGHDPFAYAPEDIAEENAPRGLMKLAESSGEVIERVTYPHLATIYPPVSQAAFTVAHVIAPWDLLGLRVVFLALDVMTIGLLLLLLRQLHLPAAWLLVYWWNPLLVKELYNSTHMEIVVVVFVAAALLMAVRQRWVLAAAALALGVGAKLWPVMLLPVLARQKRLSWKQGGLMVACFSVVTALVTLPLLLHVPREESGLTAYATQWQVNAGLFQVVHAAMGLLPAVDAHAAARLMVAVLLGGWVLWLCRRPAADGRAVCERALWAVAALFMLSPVQYPWYWMWLMPMLAVRHSPGLLLLTALLPLYYLRFPMEWHGLKAWFDHGVVWLQYAPVLALLVWEFWRDARRGGGPGGPVGAVNLQSGQSASAPVPGGSGS